MKQYHVGRFEVTDKKGSLQFIGFVEKDIVIKSLFWVNIGYFSGDFLSMTFTSVELRTLCEVFSQISHGSYDDSYSKVTGGKNKIKTIAVKQQSQYITVSIATDGKKLDTSILRLNAGSLAKEIELLINESVISSYKAQQYFARKQKHAQKQ